MPQVFRRLTAPASPRAPEEAVRTVVKLSPEREKLQQLTAANEGSPIAGHSVAAYLDQLLEAHEAETGHRATSSQRLEEEISMRPSQKVPEEEAKKIFDRLYKSGKDYRVRRKVYHELGLLVEQAKEAQTCTFEPRVPLASYPGGVQPQGSITERLYRDGFERRRRQEERMMNAPVPSFRPRTSLRAQFGSGLSPRDTISSAQGDEGLGGNTLTGSEFGGEDGGLLTRDIEPPHFRLFREHEERKARQRMRQEHEAEWRKHSYRPDISTSQASGPRILRAFSAAGLPQEETGCEYIEEDVDEEDVLDDVENDEVGELGMPSGRSTPGSSMVVSPSLAAMAAAATMGAPLPSNGAGASPMALLQSIQGGGGLSVVSRGSTEASAEAEDDSNVSPSQVGIPQAAASPSGLNTSARLVPQPDALGFAAAQAREEAEAAARAVEASQGTASPGGVSPVATSPQGAEDWAGEVDGDADVLPDLSKDCVDVEELAAIEECSGAESPERAQPVPAAIAGQPMPPRTSAAAAEAAAVAAYHANQAMAAAQMAALSSPPMSQPVSQQASLTPSMASSLEVPQLAQVPQLAPTSVRLSPRGAVPQQAAMSASTPVLLPSGLPTTTVAMAPPSGASSEISLGAASAPAAAGGAGVGGVVTYVVPTATTPAPPAVQTPGVPPPPSVQQLQQMQQAQQAQMMQQMAQVQQMQQQLLVQQQQLLSPLLTTPRLSQEAPTTQPQASAAQEAPPAQTPRVPAPGEPMRGISREASAAAFHSGACLTPLAASPQAPSRTLSGRATPRAGLGGPAVVTTTQSTPVLQQAPSAEASGRATPVMVSRPASGGPPPARGRPMPGPHVLQQMGSPRVPGGPPQVALMPVNLPMNAGGGQIVVVPSGAGAQPGALTAVAPVLRQVGVVPHGVAALQPRVAPPVTVTPQLAGMSGGRIAAEKAVPAPGAMSPKVN